MVARRQADITAEVGGVHVCVVGLAHLVRTWRGPTGVKKGKQEDIGGGGAAALGEQTEKHLELHSTVAQQGSSFSLCITLC